MTDSFWKKFEKSGSVEDYLDYACASWKDDLEMAVTDEYDEFEEDELEEAMERWEDSESSF